jgi:hypothetical protein
MSRIFSEPFEKKICLMHGRLVIFDRDLAVLSGIETRHLVETVEGNATEFPPGSVFQLTQEEMEIWRLRTASSDPSVMRTVVDLPCTFTAKGIERLSRLFHDEHVSRVMDFISQCLSTIEEQLDLSARLTRLERKYKSKFHSLLLTTRQLMKPNAIQPQTLLESNDEVIHNLNLQKEYSDRDVLDMIRELEYNGNTHCLKRLSKVFGKAVELEGTIETGFSRYQLSADGLFVFVGLRNVPNEIRGLVVDSMYQRDNWRRKLINSQAPLQIHKGSR